MTASKFCTETCIEQKNKRKHSELWNVKEKNYTYSKNTYNDKEEKEYITK